MKSAPKLSLVEDSASDTQCVCIKQCELFNRKERERERKRETERDRQRGRERQRERERESE